MKNYKIALVGATGLVGSIMLKVLEEYKWKDITLIPTASARSVGKTITYFGKEYKIVSVDDAIAACPDIAIFSAGAQTSLAYAERFAATGCFVIDNSSAWRMYPNIPLVVPEINANTISEETKIIANPNCSTIQLVMALAPLHKKYTIKRVVISTYQSVTGSGVKGVNQLENEMYNKPCAEKAYPYPIHRNIIPHGGDFNDNGYTSEEEKLINETKKILSAQEMAITATVVRVPVTGGHSESVNIAFEKDFNLEDIRSILSNEEGIELLDNPSENIYPMPLFSEGKNEVFVGRIRRDFSNPNSLNLWIVSDNLRKGAATNAIQIAHFIKENFSAH